MQNKKSFSTLVGLVLLILAVFLIMSRRGVFSNKNNLSKEELFVYSSMETLRESNSLFMAFLTHSVGLKEEIPGYISKKSILCEYSEDALPECKNGGFFGAFFEGYKFDTGNIFLVSEKFTDSGIKVYEEAFLQSLSSSITAKEEDVINSFGGVLLVEKNLTFSFAEKDILEACDAGEKAVNELKKKKFEDLSWFFKAVREYFINIKSIDGLIYVTEGKKANMLELTVHMTEAAEYGELFVKIGYLELSNKIAIICEIAKDGETEFSVEGNGNLIGKSKEINLTGTMSVKTDGTDHNPSEMRKFSFGTTDLQIQKDHGNNIFGVLFLVDENWERSAWVDITTTNTKKFVNVNYFQNDLIVAEERIIIE